MVVSMPRKGIVNTEPRDMVRIQLKPNDIRSYTRQEAEELIAKTPGAFIVGEEEGQALSGEGKTFDEAAEDFKAKAGVKAARTAPNKARQPKAPASPSPAETKTEPPAPSNPDPVTVETKSE